MGLFGSKDDERTDGRDAYPDDEADTGERAGRAFNFREYAWVDQDGNKTTCPRCGAFSCTAFTGRCD